MKVQVVGPGCGRCRQLARNVADALAQARLACEVEHVQDIVRIAEMGIMLTPALVIDGTVKSSGRVLTAGQVREILAQSE